MSTPKKKQSIAIKFNDERNVIEASNPCQLTKGILNFLLMLHGYLMCATLLSFKFKNDFRPFIAFKRETIRQLESKEELFFAESKEEDILDWNLKYIRQTSTKAIGNYELTLTMSLITSALYCLLWSLYVVSNFCGWITHRPLLSHCLYTTAKLSFNIFATSMALMSFIVLGRQIHEELRNILQLIAPLNERGFLKIESIFHCVGGFRANVKENGTLTHNAARHSWPVCEESVPEQLPAVWVLLVILSSIILIWLFDLLLMYSSFLSEPIDDSDDGFPYNEEDGYSIGGTDLTPNGIECTEIVREETEKSTEEIKDEETEILTADVNSKRAHFSNNLV